MKALVLTKKVPYPALDGECLVIVQDINYLIELGYEIYVLSLNTNKHYIHSEESQKHLPLNVKLIGIDINTDLKIIDSFFNLFSSIPYNISRFYSLKFEQQLIKLVQDNDFKVILFEGLHLAVYSAVIPYHTKSSMVMRSHNVESEIWFRKAALESNLFKKSYTNYLANKIQAYEKKSLNNFNKFIAISDRDLKKYQALYLNTTSLVIPYSLKSFELKLNLKDPHSVFFIGSFDWEPNYTGVVWFIKNVWHDFYSKNPHWTFYIAGRKMNIHDPLFSHSGIKLLGEFKDVSTLLYNYNVMVVPLFYGSGIRIKIIEALFYAKPIISTNIGAEGIYVSNDSGILIADDKNSFLQALETLSQSEENTKLIGEKNRTFAIKHFSFETQIKKLQKFFN